MAARAVVPTDFDDRRDVDLLLAGPDGPPQLFRNGRDGTFKDVAGEVGLAPVRAARAVAAGDVNKDDFPDFFFGGEGAPGLFALSDGKTHFTIAPGPPAARDARQAMFLDYHGDGLLDLVVLAADGLHVARNLGQGRWADVTQAAIPAAARTRADAPAVAFAAADLDGDGATDLVVRLASGAVRVLLNRGRVNHALAV